MQHNLSAPQYQNMICGFDEAQMAKVFPQRTANEIHMITHVTKSPHAIDWMLICNMVHFLCLNTCKAPQMKDIERV
jgi:hypothetical protein